MGLKERVKQFIEYTGIEVRAFEVRCNLSNGFVNNIGQSIREKSINNITEVYPDLNRYWLLTGEGSMLNSEKARPAKKIENNSNELNELKERIKELEEVIRDLKEDKSTQRSYILKLEESLMQYEGKAKTGTN